MHGRDNQAWRIALGGLLALAAAMGIGRFIYTPILPFMEAALGLSKSQGGLIASVNYLGYLLGALGASIATVPGSQRTWLMTMLCVSVASTAAMAASTSMTAFIVVRFIGGVASAYVLVFASTLVFDALGRASRPGLTGLHFAGVGTGIALSAILVAALAQLDHDWPALWLAGGAVSLAALMAVAWLIPAEDDGAASSSLPAGARGGRRLTALIVAYGFFGFGYVITATFISTMVRADPEIQALEQTVWLVVGLTAAPSVVLWIWVGWKIGNGASIALACLAEALGVALSVLASGALAIMLAAALLGGTFVGISAVGLIHARHLTRGNPRRALALMTASFGLGQMIGPGFAGILHDQTSSFTAPSLAAAAALGVAAMLVVIPARRHRQ